MIYLAIFQWGRKAIIMNKFITGITLSLTLLGVGPAYADGAAIFKSYGCSVCHDPKLDNLNRGLGPSLTMVSETYKAAGGKDALISFFLREREPIISSKKFAVMRIQLRKIKKLSDAERSDLADFILSH